MDKPEALRLAELLETDGWPDAAAELRRLHATVQAREDEIQTHSAAVYEATKLLSDVRAENASLAAALASACDEQRHELWESGGIAGCERARVAERQRDALLALLGRIREWHHLMDAAIAAAEGEMK